MRTGFVIFLLCLFLIINLVLGFLKGRDVKTVKDFAIGNKKFGTFALSATLLATVVGGGAIHGTCKQLVSIGLAAIVGVVFHCMSFVGIGALLTNQISRFNDCLSLGDFVGKLYGKIAKSFCGFISWGVCIFNISAQIQILGYIFSDLFGLNLIYAIIYSTIIISVYTTFGGMNSVVATDIMQIIMTIIMLILMMYFTMSHFGDFTQIIMKMPNRLFSTKALTGEYCVTRIPLLLFLGHITEVPEFQRLLMANNQEQAKKMYFYTAIIRMIIGVCLVLIVFFAIAFLGDNINSKNPIHYIINHSIPAKFIPFIGIGLISVIFSTGDSYLHSAGLSLSKDFLEPIIKRDIKLYEVRFITFFSGIVSMLVVLWNNNLLFATKIGYLGDTSFIVAVLYGFLGFKSSKRMFWISAIFGTLGLLISSYVPTLKSFNVVIGCFTSLFAYFAVHLYENKGFKFVGNPIFPDDVKKRFRDRFSFKFPDKHAFLFALKQKVSLRSFFYRKSAVVLSGIILFRNMVYMKGNPYQLFCLYLGLLGVVIIVFMMSHIYFPIKLRIFTPVFWYATLMYVFSFLLTTECLLHGIKPLPIRMLFVIIFSFLLMFARWELAFVLSWIGSCLAVLVSKLIVSYNPSDFVVHIPTLANVTLWYIGIALLLGAFVAAYDKKEEDETKSAAKRFTGQKYSTVEVIWHLVHTPQTIKDAYKEERAARHSIMYEAEEMLEKDDKEQFQRRIKKLKKRFENPIEDKYTFALFPKFHDKEYLIAEYRDAAILAGCSHVSLEIDKKVELVNCDRMVIEKAIWKFVIDYCNIAEANFAEDTDAVLSIYSTTIDYQMELPKRPYYPIEYESMGILPAVGISISEREIFRSNCSPIKECYTKKIRAEFRRILLDSQDDEMRDAMLGVDAHYGIVEIDEKNLCWQCIIPVDYRIIDERVLTSRAERKKRSYEDY